MRCPVCGSDGSRPLFEGSFYLLRLCLRCGSNFQVRTGTPSTSYEREYFTSGHRNAYGTTYMEDEANIRAIARRRLEIIERMIPAGGGILDIGSAMGLFCHEATRRGFRATGVEISEYARDFAGREFGVTSRATLDEVEGPFDAVTLWFVLEHMEEPRSWLRRCRSLVSDGGIICLAVPNAAGALARFNGSLYRRLRPQEHFFEPTPGALRLLLKASGFSMNRIEYFGLHPERVHLPDWTVIRTLQRKLRLGDTFEVYGTASL
ncbi:MAG: class I SAM-dependent methyltransferase [Spirochaetes bacterium]|nr:class I SAM-dependent methyltransferase [Spirochaetota bacterium]